MLFEDSGRDFDIMLERNEPSVIRRMVETGLGVAFRPARLVMRHRANNDRPEINWAMRVTGYTYDTPTCISKKKSRFLLHSAAMFYDPVIAVCQAESEVVKEFLKNYNG